MAFSGNAIAHCKDSTYEKEITETLKGLTYDDLFSCRLLLHGINTIMFVCCNVMHLLMMIPILLNPTSKRFKGYYKYSKVVNGVYPKCLNALACNHGNQIYLEKSLV